MAEFPQAIVDLFFKGMSDEERAALEALPITFQDKELTLGEFLLLGSAGPRGFGSSPALFGRTPPSEAAIPPPSTRTGLSTQQGSASVFPGQADDVSALARGEGTFQTGLAQQGVENIAQRGIGQGNIVEQKLITELERSSKASELLLAQGAKIEPTLGKVAANTKTLGLTTKWITGLGFVGIGGLIAKEIFQTVVMGKFLGQEESSQSVDFAVTKAAERGDFESERILLDAKAEVLGENMWNALQGANANIKIQKKVLTSQEKDLEFRQSGQLTPEQQFFEDLRDPTGSQAKGAIAKENIELAQISSREDTDTQEFKSRQLGQARLASGETTKGESAREKAARQKLQAGQRAGQAFAESKLQSRAVSKAQAAPSKIKSSVVGANIQANRPERKKKVKGLL